MDKIAYLLSDWVFKLSMLNVPLIIGINLVTEYNVNIAATIVWTVIAAIFGYWRIKTQKLIAKRTEEEIKLTKQANKLSKDELDKKDGE